MVDASSVRYFCNMVGFKKAGYIITSEKYKQGVATTFTLNKKDWKKPGVYMFVSPDEKILKFGESRSLAHRLGVQYVSITNQTNNRIREAIKNKYNQITFYFAETPMVNYKMGEFELEGSLQRELEEACIKKYKELNNGDLPELNFMIK